MSRALLLVLALTLTSTSPAVAGTVVNNPNFLFPTVPYAFSTATNTFTGVGDNGFLVGFPLEETLSATLTVTFTDLGAFVGGTFQVTGEIAGLGIPPASLLMQGEVTGISDIDEAMGPAGVTHFVVDFDLEIDTVHPLLGFAADSGSWIAFVCNPTTLDCGNTGPVSITDLFTTDYINASVPVNNEIRSSQHVPYPAAGLLLGLGFALLAARQRLHRS